MRSDEQDARIHARAIAYAQGVMMGIRNTNGAALTEEDIARAFVVAYSAGLEDGRSVIGRRTVGRR